MVDIPNSWQLAPLNELVNPDRGIAYGVLKPGPQTLAGIPMIRVTDINTNRYDPSSVYYISSALDQEFRRTKLQGGEILISIQGTVGKVAIAPASAAGSNVSRTIAVTPLAKQDMTPWVRQYLLSPYGQESMEGEITGTTRSSLNLCDLRVIEIPIAPELEQHRIVAKLDALQSHTRLAREALAAIPTLLDHYRQSVLAAAFRGELTADWRKANGVTHDWPEVTVSSIAEKLFDGPFGSNLKSDDYSDSGVRVVRLENIGHLHFVEDKRTFISDEKYAGLTRHTLLAGDVLLSSFVDEAVRVCVLPQEHHGKAINKADCFCVRPDQRRCSSQFLAFCLACRSTFTALEDLVHGATRPRINIGS